MALGALPGRKRTPTQEEEPGLIASAVAVAGSAGSELGTVQAGI